MDEVILKFLQLVPLVLAFKGVAFAVVPEVHVLGTGPDVSYVVIQEKSLSTAPLIFAYHYTYASNPPMSGDALLSFISASYPELQIQTTQYSFGKSLDAFDVQGTTISDSTAPDGNSGTYWSYYVSGGYDGSGAVNTNQWLYSQYGFDSRTITPGSCDGWTFASWHGTNEPSDVPPSVDVPNIASLVTAASATLTSTPTPTPTPAANTNPLAINVGDGPDISFVVIQEPSLSSRPIVFAYHYTNASSPPINGYQLLLAIHAGYPDFDFATTQYSFGKSLDAFRFGGTTVSSSTAPDGNGGYYWSYYLCGGYDGSGAVGTYGWSYSQYGFESRTIAPGSCDGWTLASWQGTNGMDVPPIMDPTFLATIAIGSGAVPTMTSASPTPAPSPMGVLTPAPAASVLPSSSSTPQGSSGGGAVSGGFSPMAPPQSASPVAAPPSVNAPTPVTPAAYSEAAISDGSPHAVSDQKSAAVIAGTGQGSYAPPAWLQAAGFIDPFNVSMSTAQSSGFISNVPRGFLKVMTPFEPEKLTFRNKEGHFAFVAPDPIRAPHTSGVGGVIQAHKAEGSWPGLLQGITGWLGRFWKYLLQFF